MGKLDERKRMLENRVGANIVMRREKRREIRMEGIENGDGIQLQSQC